MAWPTLYGEYLIQFDPERRGSYFSSNKPSDPVKVRQDFIWREGENPKDSAAVVSARSPSGRSSTALTGSAIPVAHVVGDGGRQAPKQVEHKEPPDSDEVEVQKTAFCSGQCPAGKVCSNYATVDPDVPSESLSAELRASETAHTARTAAKWPTRLPLRSEP